MLLVTEILHYKGYRNTEISMKSYCTYMYIIINSNNSGLNASWCLTPFALLLLILLLLLLFHSNLDNIAQHLKRKGNILCITSAFTTDTLNLASY